MARSSRSANSVDPSRRFHIHMEVSPGLTPILWDSLSPEQFKASAARFPGCCEGLDLTFGNDRSSLDEQLSSCEVLLMAGPQDLVDVQARAPKLRWIQYTGTGVEALTPKAELRRDVVITNARGVQTEKAVEYVIASVLMLHNRFPDMLENQRQAVWDPLPTAVISDKTVLILGMGSLGSPIAKAMKHLGLRVLGISRSGRADRSVDEMGRTQDLPAMLPRADFLVVTLPLTPETHSLIGRAELAMLPHGAGIVNIGRGPIIDYDALSDKLREKALSGAILDVFYEEPLPAVSPLWSVPNVIITPHCCLQDPVNYGPRCMDIFFDNLARYRAGRKLRNIIDMNRGY